VKVIFSSQAWEEYLAWQQTDRHIFKRINTLINDIRREPYRGKGKPEPLKYALSGYWSRRISEEHRLVYRVEKDKIFIAQVRYHY
jgi:toxin YoeB